MPNHLSSLLPPSWLLQQQEFKQELGARKADEEAAKMNVLQASLLQHQLHQQQQSGGKIAALQAAVKRAETVDGRGRAQAAAASDPKVDDDEEEKKVGG
jgi:hypothetical protein